MTTYWFFIDIIGLPYGTEHALRVDMPPLAFRSATPISLPATQGQR